MKKQILILALGSLIPLASIASVTTEQAGSCTDDTGLPECGTVAPGNHCCVDTSKIPKVQCFGDYAAVQASDGHWFCELVGHM